MRCCAEGGWRVRGKPTDGLEVVVAVVETNPPRTEHVTAASYQGFHSICGSDVLAQNQLKMHYLSLVPLDTRLPFDRPRPKCLGGNSWNRQRPGWPGALVRGFTSFHLFHRSQCRKKLKAVEVSCRENTLPVETEGSESRKCPKCQRPKRVCLCDALPEKLIETQTQVVLFTHPKEEKRSLGTAPLLQLCLKRTIKFIGKEFPDPEDNPSLHEQLRQGGRKCFLMYPGPDASQIASLHEASPMSLILIDARWEQARIMLNRSDWLKTLPRITVPHQQSGYVWRRQPAPGCISTLEAAAEALQVLEAHGDQVKQTLLAPFEKMVNLQCQFIPNAQDKNADLHNPLGSVAKENANPLWSRSRKRKRRRKQKLGVSSSPV